MAASNEDRSNAEKEKGNQCFKKKDYPGAVRHYTAALQHDPGNSLIVSNRAMAYLKMERFLLAKLDCERALFTEPNNVKAQFRLGLALSALKHHAKAEAAFENTLRLDPKNCEASKELEKTRKLLDSTDVNLLLPIFKPVEARSKASLRWLNAADAVEPQPSTSVTGPDSKAVPGSRPDSNGAPVSVKVPPPPTHPLELLSTWKSLRLQDRWALNEYIWNIPHDSYGRLFGQFLDGDLLSDLVDCLAAKSTLGVWSEIRERLLSVSKVNRFSTVVLFISQKNKQDLVTMCEEGSLGEIKPIFQLT